MTMDALDMYEPLPLHSPQRGSPSGVDGVGMVPIVEFGKGKRKAAAAKPSARKATRASRSSSRDKRNEDDDSNEEKEDDDDEPENGGDPSDDDDESVEDQSDATGVIVEGELRDATFPGATARNDPLYWQFQYRRENRGVEACWVCGTTRWASRDRAAVWGAMFAEQIAANFSLSTFVENFVDFARTRPRCFTVASADPRVQRPVCPVPGFDPTAYSAVNVRSASNADLQLPTGTHLPKSVWQVTLTGADRSKTTWHMLWSVWTRQARTMASLITEWGNQHPNASFETIDRIMAQVRVPAGAEAMTAVQVAALANGVNCDAPPPVAAQPAPPPMPALQCAVRSPRKEFPNSLLLSWVD